MSGRQLGFDPSHGSYHDSQHGSQYGLYNGAHHAPAHHAHAHHAQDLNQSDSFTVAHHPHGGMSDSNHSKAQSDVADTFANEPTTNRVVEIGRFVFTLVNFGTTFIFAIVLLTHAFQMDDITGSQVFSADRVLQSFDQTDRTSVAGFIKTTYGPRAEVLPLVNDVVRSPEMLPSMYEMSGSDSVLRLESVHCNFMLFSALWIASAFSLAMIQLPGTHIVQWDTIRVLIVHAWNLLGLIITVVLYSATTKWGYIPTSNLFYTVVGQVMAWMYQYFHMVECTQVHIATLQLQYRTLHDPLKNIGTTKHGPFDIAVSTQFSSELRKMIYMEFSIVVPMLLVAGIIPGAVGMDEWRVQTVLFSSWILFALLGLHLRYRKALQSATTQDIITDDSDVDPIGLDALGYLTYAIVMTYMMLVNAVGMSSFADTPFFTDRIRQCRWGVRILVILAGLLVLETVVKTLKLRFSSKDPEPTKPKNSDSKDTKSSDAPPESKMWILPPFLANLFIIGFGSLLVNILIFSGLSDVNSLTTWSI
jgi:hypothetical protein